MRKRTWTPLSRVFALAVIAPFLMGFELRQDEGYTGGLGGTAGRGHYSSSCSREMYRQEFAAGLGWQGRDFGAWVGHAITPYLDTGHRLSLSYRFDAVTLLDSLGVFSGSGATFPGDYGAGGISRMTLGARFNL